MSASKMLKTLKVIRAQLSGSESLAALGSLASCATYTRYQPFARVKGSWKTGGRDFVRGEEATALAEIMMPNQPLDLWLHGLLSYLRPLGVYRSACDVNQLIEDARSALEPQRAAKEVEIALHLSPLPQLTADPLWLGQALLAILANALDTSARKQCVAISSEVNGEFVSVSTANGVQETSQALPEEAFDHTRANPEMVGLGLTMARRIVEAHQGRMVLYSDAGKSRMVMVHLPLLPAPLRF